MDQIALEDLALLEVLHRVEDQVVLTHADSVMRQRMLDHGLVTEEEFGLQLTTAGIELCKSLQHRVAADAQVAKLRAER